MDRAAKYAAVILLIAGSLLLLPCCFGAYVAFVVIRDGENFWEPRYSLFLCAVGLLIVGILFLVARARGKNRGWSRLGWVATIAGYSLLLRHVIFVFELDDQVARPIGLVFLPALIGIALLGLILDLRPGAGAKVNVA